MTPAPRVEPQHARIGGLDLEYVDTGGRGPVLMLVHGTGASWRVWGPTIAALAASHRVIAPSLPGCGRSARLATRPHDLAPYAAVLISLADYLVVPRASVVGHSLGGLVSLRLALDAPERVDRLVLVDSGGVRIGRFRLMFIVGALRVVRWICAQRWVVAPLLRRPRVRARLLRGLVEDNAAVPDDFLDLMVADFGSAGVPESIAAGARERAHERVADVEVPVHLVWGSRDQVLPLRLARHLQDELPRATLDVIDGSGHVPMVENPREFQSVLRRRLDDIVVREQTS